MSDQTTITTLARKAAAHRLAGRIADARKIEDEIERRLSNMSLSARRRAESALTEMGL